MLHPKIFEECEKTEYCLQLYGILCYVGMVRQWRTSCYTAKTIWEILWCMLVNRL